MKAFTRESARQVTYLWGVRNDCFLLNEVGDLYFFCITYSSSLCCKTLKKIYVRKKSYREKCIRSHHSWTQNCLLGITHPRNIYNQCLFMSCAGVIKQTLKYSFWTIQHTFFVISSSMSKLCLLFWPNVAWIDGAHLSLIDEVAMIKWVTWESYISHTSLVTYVFYCTLQVTIMWGTIEKFKENLTTTSITKESP